MKKRQQKIKSFVNSIQNHTHWYMISIAFDASTYFRRLNHINDFYRRISNSKASLTGLQTNRSWWKRIMPSGIYETTLTDEALVLNFIITTDSKLNELEFKSRAKKICPYISLTIGYQEKKELEKVVANNYFSYRQNIELFGNLKRNTPEIIYN